MYRFVSLVFAFSVVSLKLLGSRLDTVGRDITTSWTLLSSSISNFSKERFLPNQQTPYYVLVVDRNGDPSHCSILCPGMAAKT